MERHEKRKEGTTKKKKFEERNHDGELKSVHDHDKEDQENEKNVENNECGKDQERENNECGKDQERSNEEERKKRRSSHTVRFSQEDEYIEDDNFDVDEYGNAADENYSSDGGENSADELEEGREWNWDDVLEEGEDEGEEEDEDVDWKPTEDEVKEHDAEANDDFRPVNPGGGRLKSYKESLDRSRFSKVKKMLDKNKDKELNLAFARRVLRDEKLKEKKRQEKEEEADYIRGNRNLAAWSLITRRGFSIRDWNEIKNFIESRSSLGESNHTVPSYNMLKKERKKCLPDGWPRAVDTTEQQATVSWQDLLDHTVKRYAFPKVLFTSKCAKVRNVV